MDLSKVKVGDEVYSILKGWKEVEELFLSTFLVTNEYVKNKQQYSSTTEYYKNGKRDLCDVNPEITAWKPKKRE